MTGLALLAFLAAGHTHESGDYRQTVCARLAVSGREPGGRWQPGRPRRKFCFHVLPRHGGARAERSLRHDRRPPLARAGEARRRLHAGRAEPHHRRLALSAARRGRHQSARMAAHVSEKRGPGRRANAARLPQWNRALSANCRFRPAWWPGRLSSRPGSDPTDDGRSPGLPALPGPGDHAGQCRGGRLPAGRIARRVGGQFLLLVLRHPGLVPGARRALAAVEPGGGHGAGAAPTQRRQRGRQLGSRPHLGQLRRPGLFDGARDTHASKSTTASCRSTSKPPPAGRRYGERSSDRDVFGSSEPC